MATSRQLQKVLVESDGYAVLFDFVHGESMHQHMTGVDYAKSSLSYAERCLLRLDAIEMWVREERTRLLARADAD